MMTHLRETVFSEEHICRNHCRLTSTSGTRNTNDLSSNNIIRWLLVPVGNSINDKSQDVRWLWLSIARDNSSVMLRQDLAMSWQLHINRLISAGEQFDCFSSLFERLFGTSFEVCLFDWQLLTTTGTSSHFTMVPNDTEPNIPTRPSPNPELHTGPSHRLTAITTENWIPGPS